MMNQYTQKGFVPSIPVGMVIALVIIFAIAVVLGAFYKNRTPRFFKERGLNWADNAFETFLVVIIVDVIIGVCYFDGATQLLINILHRNTDTDVAYAYALSAIACGMFAACMGAAYFNIKKISYKKLHRLVAK